MKRLIVKIYRIVYHVTGARMFSFIFALLYITGLNLVTIYGLGLLLQDLFPTSIILKLFAFPYFIATSLAMFVANLLLAPSFNYITVVERQKKSNYTPVVIYTAISLLLFVYTRFYDKIF